MSYFQSALVILIFGIIITHSLNSDEKNENSPALDSQQQQEKADFLPELNSLSDFYNSNYNTHNKNEDSADYQVEKKSAPRRIFIGKREFESSEEKDDKNNNEEFETAATNDDSDDDDEKALSLDKKNPRRHLFLGKRAGKRQIQRIFIGKRAGPNRIFIG
jgi:hypothetical protein